MKFGYHEWHAYGFINCIDIINPIFLLKGISSLKIHAGRHMNKTHKMEFQFHFQRSGYLQ